MSDGKTRRTIPLRLMLLVMMGFMILYLGAGFTRQIGINRQRREELRQIEQEIEAARQKTVGLEERLLYVQSPVAAEEWARENGWAKQDEVSVVLVAPSAKGSSEEGRELKPWVEPRSNRDAWWDWFFGER